ncbi:ClpP-like prohead protease/major capsid protein fusion protein [Ancylobacter oerskovii]|uniref:ClpP-like prohead protease/major capsid protein fusion protein n=1 Tax=Ancylobacter oerskovii TaxID=459519 RepID=A0ABW4Z2V2_9HYPH|nr:ClpP-like prohead protease/major capsid protein fusion protein [Ancylobacter oerskovii]MBS7546240.1 Clp protease ClpP [Ancylobacter oerskovii]
MPKNLLVDGEMVLYGPVGGSIWDDAGFTAADVIHTLAGLDGADVTARINSGGGVAWEGIAIYNAFKGYDGKVTIVVDAVAASAASVIAMAGAERIMRTGALLMIHNASTIAWGQKRDLQKSANLLDKIDVQMANLYAKSTGLARAETAQMMEAETWFTGEEAVAKGFATSTDDAESTDASTWNYAIYSRAPETLAPFSKPFPKNHPAAAAAQQEVTMTMPNAAAQPAPAPVSTTPAPAPAPVPPVPAADTRPLAVQVLARCRAANLTIEQAEAIVAQAKTPEHAADLILTEICNAQDKNGPESRPHQAAVTGDARDRFRIGMEKALLGKAGLAGGEANEFTSYKLTELARASLQHAGVKPASHDVLAMVGAAFTAAPTAMHGTSDFPLVLSNVANKAMLKGYTEAETTYQLWTAKGSLGDFKLTTRADTGFFPILSKVEEGEEYQYASFGERGETGAIGTYGKLFKISRQAIINDDMGVFTRTPMKMGAAARRTINKLVYGVLNTNPAMADSVALFHATHGNLAAGAGNVGVTSDVYAKSLAAMRKQKEGDVTLGISPKYVLTPMEHYAAVRQIFLSATELGQANPSVPSKVAGEVVPIADAELDLSSGTLATYLAADPNAFDTVEVMYLDGNESPLLEQQDGWKIDGVEFKVRSDFGVKAWGYRGLRKIPVA